MNKILFVFGFAGFLFFSTATQAAGDATAGKAKFETMCATCHGPAGAGDGPAATALNPKPRNLQVTKQTDEEMKKIIKEGGPAAGLSTSMPAWGPALSDADINNVIAYIRTLAKPAAQPAPAQPQKK